MSPPTRRQFITTASAATLGAISHAQNGAAAPPLRLGLVGCGGRGTMIADMAKASGLFTIVGAADYFQDRVAGFAARYGLPEARCFTGLDGYRRLFEAGGLDAVAIESPPFFHPLQTLTAIKAGLHVYLAKPVAVDEAGCRIIEEAAKLAAEKKRVILVDFQTRAVEPFQKAIAKVREGVLGDFSHGQAIYESGRLNPHEGGETPAEKRLRNWVFDIALSGDIITEQNVHTLDVMGWIMGQAPVSATGICSRKGRTDIGDCHDHFSVLFNFPGQVPIHFHSRQYGGWGDPGGITNRVFGSKGMISTEYGGKVRLRGEEGVNMNAGDTPAIYRDGPNLNLAEFSRAIHAGDASNPTVAPSVMSNRITQLGRLAAFRPGEIVKWEDALADTQPIDGKLAGLKV
ncbi:MAG: Gfo/Idh/MocA family protein [Verrucomicrobiales bacterium]